MGGDHLIDLRLALYGQILKIKMLKLNLVQTTAKEGGDQQAARAE